MKLDFSISLSVKVGHKHAVLYFCFFELGIRPSVFTKVKINQVNPSLVGFNFLSLASC